MKEITQVEFEQKIRDIISRKTTRAKLLKELKVDKITLNNKIQELYISNSELYFEFISKFPYIPREYTHIDYEAMVIDIMKKGYGKKQVEEQYGISSRTIARKIKKLEDENPVLIDLYRRVAYYKTYHLPLPETLQREVDALEEREVFIGGIYDKREAELLEKEKQYNESRMAGISDIKAYGSRRTIKDLSTLYRIEIEQRVTQENNQNSNTKNSKKEITDESEER